MTAELDTMPQSMAAAPGDAARNRLVIALLLLSTFVVFLNETIMSVAIPHLMHDLNIPATTAQWLTTAFMLTMAVVIPITGFLLQRVNTRPVFILAMSLFSLGTLICAAAPGFPVLLVGRVVQATGTAIMMPLLMTTLMTLVPPESRGKTMGNVSIVMSVAPAIGPTISGIILNYLSWRWMFILVLPIALLALLVGGMRIRNVSTPRYAPLDILSVILSAFGFGGFVYGLSSFGEGGGGQTTWISLAVGVAALAVFIFRQLLLQREDKALLDLRTFQHRIYALSVTLMAVCMMSLFGIVILLPIYMQNVLGLSTLTSGLILLPGGLIMGLMGPFVGRLYDRFGPKPLVVPGAIIVSVVLWSMTLFGLSTPVPVLAVAYSALCVGLALMFTPLFTAGLGALPRQLYSHGSAVIGTVQQVAGAAGAALYVALMSLTAASLIAGGSDPVVATGEGIRVAFVWAGCISLVAVAGSLFIRKPEDSAGGMAMAH